MIGDDFLDCLDTDWLNWARIDIKNRGEGNDIKISLLEEKKCIIYNAPWFSEGGKGYVIETKEKHLMLDLECLGAGDLLIRLQGLDRHSKGGERIPLLVDYTRMAVNEEVIFWEIKSQWHDKVYPFIKKVKDGEKVKVDISWSHHEYKGDELARLLSLWAT